MIEDPAATIFEDAFAQRESSLFQPVIDRGMRVYVWHSHFEQGMPAFPMITIKRLNSKAGISDSLAVGSTSATSMVNHVERAGFSTLNTIHLILPVTHSPLLVVRILK